MSVLWACMMCSVHLAGLSSLQSADPALPAARNAQPHGDHAEAIRVYAELVDREPNNVAYLLELAKAHHAAKAADAALDALRRIHALSPQHEEARILHARILALQEDWSEVIRILKPLANTTKSYEVCHLLAKACRHRGLDVDAAWYYQKASELNPKAIDDQLQLGRLHLKGKQPALAVRAFEAALEQGHEDAFAHFQLAQAYYALGRPLGAVRVVPLKRALPGSLVPAGYVLSAVAGEVNRYQVCSIDSAIYHLHKALDLNLNQPEAHLLNADIWYQAREFERARQIYETIGGLVPAPDLAGYHYRFGRTLLELEDPEGFERHLNRAIELDSAAYQPQAKDAYLRIADFYCLRGQLSEYIEYLRRAITEAPADVQLRYRLANALLEAERTAEAKVAYITTLQLDPNHPDRERMLGIINDPMPGGPDDGAP